MCKNPFKLIEFGIFLFEMNERYSLTENLMDMIRFFCNSTVLSVYFNQNGNQLDTIKWVIAFIATLFRCAKVFLGV